MKSERFLLSLLAFVILWAPRAYSATVAVMPVQGVNLSEGECDAIGVLFANAFSRDANVAVASPLETKFHWQAMSMRDSFHANQL